MIGEGPQGEKLDVNMIPKNQWTPEMREKASQAANDVVSSDEKKAKSEKSEQAAGANKEEGVDLLFDPNYEGGSVEDAAVRPQLQQKGPLATENERQMGIAAADRQQRREKGMEPPVADLR